jgi:hypothetical protein
MTSAMMEAASGIDNYGKDENPGVTIGKTSAKNE